MAGSRTAFDAEYGTAQGRILPSGWVPIDGAYVLQLGHDRPGVVYTMKAGDKVRVESTSDISATTMIRFSARQRGVSLPVGWTWRFSAWVFDVVQVFRPVERDAEMRDTAIATEVGINSAASNNAPIAFELELDGPPGQFLDAELPGVWIDALVTDTSLALGSFFWWSRNPDPAETGVPLDVLIQFTAGFLNGAASLDAAQFNVNVTVDGVTEAAMVAGVVQAGWTGALVDVDPVNSSTARVDLRRNTPFPPLTLVTVQLSSPGYGFQKSWTFTTADTIAPVVVSAFAPTELTVRVIFDEPVIAADPTAANDALNPANYTFSLLGGAPAVVPLPVSVEAESDRAVVITVDRFWTRDALYRVTVANVTDVFGNAVAAPNDTADFSGYRWPVPARRRVSIWERMPEEVRFSDDTGTGDHRRFLAVFQEMLDVYYGVADRTLDIFDPDYAPEPWVDLMLLDLGNPFDFLELGDIEKRILVRTLLAIYRTKGTGPGIVNALSFFLGIDVTIRVYAWAPFPIGQAMIGETFVLGSSTQADIYTFEVVVDRFLTDTERRNLRAVVDYMKVAHEHWRLIEPTPVVVIDHWQLGYSQLGIETMLHP